MKNYAKGFLIHSTAFKPRPKGRGNLIPLSINPEPFDKFRVVSEVEPQTSAACPEQHRRIKPRSVEGLIVVFLGAVLFLLFKSWIFVPKVCLKDVCLAVEVVETLQDRAKGLMFRLQLAENRGMLFIFPEEDFWGIWMKNTYLPLDIIWLDSNRKIVDMVENALPAKTEDPYIFKPVFSARYVLEANAGFVKKNTVKVGDNARFRWIF